MKPAEEREQLELTTPIAPVSPWCNSMIKRTWDLFWGLLLLLLLSPLFVVIALVVKLSSPGPVFFRQQRPGRGGREFAILKFRSMVVNWHQEGPILTRAADPRVTSIGRLMRKWKLDELPQIFNVIRGEMSLVGPRPQVTKLWTNLAQRKEAACVLSVRPGISSRTTLAFRNEEELLAPLSSLEVEDIYLREIMPLKISMEMEYLSQASFMTDVTILLRTVGRIFVPRSSQDAFLKQQLASVDGELAGKLRFAGKVGSAAPAELLRMREQAAESGLRDSAESLRRCQTTGEFCMILQRALAPLGFLGFDFFLYSEMPGNAECFPLRQTGRSKFRFFWSRSSKPSKRGLTRIFALDDDGYRSGRFTLYGRNTPAARAVNSNMFAVTGFSRELAQAMSRLQRDWRVTDRRPVSSIEESSASLAGD